MCENENVEREVLQPDCCSLSTCLLPFLFFLDHFVYFGSYGGRQGTPPNELPAPPGPCGIIWSPHV